MATILSLHPGAHIAIVEVGLQIGFGLKVPVARQHVPSQPLPAPGTELAQGVLNALAFGPGFQVRRGSRLEAGAGCRHISQKEVQIGQHGLVLGRIGRQQALPGFSDAIRLALGETRGRQGGDGKQFSGGRILP